MDQKLKTDTGQVLEAVKGPKTLKTGTGQVLEAVKGPKAQGPKAQNWHWAGPGSS